MKNKSLKIVGGNQRNLSKSQIKFNKLTKSIENLEKTIQSEEEKLVKLLEYFSSILKPERTNTAQLRLKFAQTVEDISSKFKFTKNQTKQIKEIIIDQCNAAFSDIQPTEEEQNLFSRWSDISFDDELERQKSAAKDMMSDFIKEKMGFDMDLSDLDDSPESFAQFQEKMKAEYEKAMQDEEEKQRKKKKTKFQIKAEEKQKAIDELKNKSLKTIYYSLAKVLHPDMEQNPLARAEKEEVMKKVTVAYEANDLSTLLKLEMEWVHKETEHLETLSEEKLKIYIEVLQEQERELRQQKQALYHHPRFSEIEDYIYLSEIHAKNNIKAEAKSEKDMQGLFKKDIDFLTKANDKKTITSYLTNYFKDDDFDDMDIDMDMLMSIFGNKGR